MTENEIREEVLKHLELKIEQQLWWTLELIEGVS